MARGGFIEYLLLIAPFPIASFVKIVSKVCAEEIKNTSLPKRKHCETGFLMAVIFGCDYASFW